MTKAILVADIGGTNARFGISVPTDGGRQITDMQNFRAVDFETVRDAADAYLESVGLRPSHACFAVAGPVSSEEVTFTNSHWRLKVDETKSGMALDTLHVINDFHALAAGVAYLPGDSFASIRVGSGEPSSPLLVIGPGTGLGQALVVPSEGSQIVVSTEGGHVAFAPRTEAEIEVMKFIAREHPRVSVERVLSGRGLVNIHRALCVMSDTPRASLQADEITKAALTGEYPIAVQAVSMFCEVLGSVVGDAVLASGARQGVVLGGGILPRIKDFFVASAFVDRFLDKGRMRTYLEDIPVRLIMQDGAALYGAAAFLEERLS
ncbi:MAG: glucokinase [Aquisalinus sp.]|nr:glucokinase [Aquisalinus sp.]